MMEKIDKQPRVIVFTTPTCSWCNTVKRYLREKHVRFRDIDVSRDANAAKDLERRGIRGVPVLLINNRPIVGFNKPEINRLIGIRG